ncbi:MAG: o-succinylbenzoate synthase [Flavobacteriaceae bacterium]|nr:o-succinylbenzoate synthase [Flavobacteriaceae bacterium]
MKAQYQKYILDFKRPSGTSRGVLHQKETYFLVVEKNQKIGIGECPIFRGLSIDDRSDYEEKLQWLCDNIHLNFNDLLKELTEFPSIQFGLEQAFLSLNSDESFTLFPSLFSQGKKGIPINGLIWMGNEDFMQEQIKEKIANGFSTIKMKIGAIDFDKEIAILQSIRKNFSKEKITLRVDANGAFTPKEALEKLTRLSELDIHSIEQPIRQGQWEEMAKLCEKTPIPIALDEELIGIFHTEKKKELLQTINPQYIILKPALVGGFSGSEEWIRLAETQKIGWWITSALESNIGLNAIAQWTYQLNATLPQGLGTGSLFTNNIESPLEVKNGHLQYNNDKNWQEFIKKI